MPSDDVVLNVKQIASYPAVSSALPTDALLLQRAGLGGPYQSITPQALAATALIVPTVGLPLQVGLAAPASAHGAQIFASAFCAILDGALQWNTSYSPTAPNYVLLEAGPAAMIALDPAAGFQFWFDPPGSAGAATPFDTLVFTISPTGYVTLPTWQTVLLGRDPYLPLEAATMQFVTGQNQATMAWVNAANQKLIDMMAAQNAAIAAYHCGSVWSVNGRTGDVLVLLSDIEAAFFAGGQPTSPMPPAGDYSYAIATTAWVTGAIAHPSGPITVSYAGPTDNQFEANDPTPPGQTGYGAWFGGSRAGVTRWYIGLGDGSQETGGNTGSLFGLWASNDDGTDAFNSNPVLSFDRIYGDASFGGDIDIQSALPTIAWQGTQQPVNQKNWDMFEDASGNLSLRALNDAYDISAQIVTYSRVGTAVTINVHSPLISTQEIIAAGFVFGTLPVNAANDAGAETAGVPVGGVYRNGSALMVRVT